MPRSMCGNKLPRSRFAECPQYTALAYQATAQLSYVVPGQSTKLGMHYPRTSINSCKPLQIGLPVLWAWPNTLGMHQ